MRWRSMLNTPGLNPRQYPKAWEAGADVASLDLEDSVPERSKDEARQQVLAFLAVAPIGGCARAVRINSLRSEHGLRDVLSLIEHRPPLDLILLPKVESAYELVMLDQLLAAKLPATAFCAIIETASGLCAVEEVARSTPRLQALIFGAADFAASLGIRMEWEALQYARSRLVTAARLAGIVALDAPCFNLDDSAYFAAEVERSARLGFTGKVAIHPRQIPTLNDAFTPHPAVVAEAREILRRSSESDGRIGVVGGQMVGPPVIRQARQVLATVGERE